MKRHILLATMLLAGMSAFAQTGYMKDIEVSGREVRRVGDEVRVTMRFDLSDVKMKRQHTTQLVPARRPRRNKELLCHCQRGERRLD